MSIPEEAGKAATSAINVFAGQPACLAAILLAGIYSWFSYQSAQEAAVLSNGRQIAIIERCFPPPQAPPASPLRERQTEKE